METPSFIEDHISQIPALQLLIKMGYRFLTPDEALELRSGRVGNVLLEGVLKKKLSEINHITYKGKEFEFSEANLSAAVLAIRDLPVQEGFINANQAFYDLITLGKSFDQAVLGDKGSFSLKYIDWETPANNIFHVTEEFAVLRSERADTYRPDVVLFINGIPMVVIECKSPKLKHPADLAIEQHLRNQQADGIRALYEYSNIVISTAVNEARYATTGTKKEFWSVWKEQFRNKEQEENYYKILQQLKDASLPNNDRTVLFRERFKYVLQFFNQLEKENLTVTEQDKLIYNLCQPLRLLDLIYNFIVYDNGEKKLCRYQQYFAVKNTLQKITKVQADGKRAGGVIWHTQGSGKSLTMVMLAQLIALNPAIKNPKIILVTDRADLDDQITRTFEKCHKEVENASTGRHLLELLDSASDVIITTLIHKFESAVKHADAPFMSPDIFVLVDEGHRSQYGTFNVKMQKIFPNACFIAFTGTPLMKKEKSTANKFGGLIDVYSIQDAVEDKAVVPLLYEGRHIMMDVNEKPMDNYFNLVSEPLSEYGKTNLKKKFSAKNKIVQSLNFIESTAWDISRHFADNIKGTGFKGQLVAPNKLSAVRYRNLLKEIGKVSVELLISAPDTREGDEDAFEESDDIVKAFWKAMIDKYGKQDNYETAIINSFKYQETPEIIIVVDKLLTGFDAPVNQVLYLTRNLKEHTLLQAIARVNRLAEGKDYGYIIDYYGNLENLDGALKMYSGDEDTFEEGDLAGTLTTIAKEVEKLPQAHSELWDIFKEIKNKYDEPAYEELLSDEAKRHNFYEKLSVFARLLKLALSSIDFINATAEKQVEKYKSDAKFFLALRVSVQRRYFDDLDYRQYEAQVQKLIDKHITTDGEVLKITELVNIFDKEKREEEVEKLIGSAAKADHIASRTLKAINVKMNEDPVFFKRLSQLIRETIDAYHQQRITEAEYLARAKEYEDNFLNGKKDNVPTAVSGNDTLTAFYNLATEELKDALETKANWIDIAAEIALAIDTAIKENAFDQDRPVVDWMNNLDIEGRIKISIDDLLFDIKSKYDLNLDFDQIDHMVTDSIKVAKIKYKG
ncbi:type I restriction endonuclease subunit R [Mucilaginibacter antarcticus]|uniref:Type I restriction enzyme endonuclease subunit n=1 Tax=Mucilaginibacter antarcticus TaxID=1855725 RepID=A0ABW5XN54_9SPHI